MTQLARLLEPVQRAWANWIDLIRYAPLVFGLAFLGEFAQHIAEVNMGMFISREAFIALQSSGMRMGFGLAKIVALFVAVFWAARWLANRHNEERPGLDGPIDWARLVPLTALSLAPLIVIAFAPIGSRDLRLILIAVALLVSLPLSRMSMDALFGRPRQTYRAAMGKRPLAPLGALLAVLPVVAAIYLHMRNHDWAFGAQSWIVWVIMIWDTILVAGLTCWMGVLTYRLYNPPIT